MEDDEPSLSSPVARESRQSSSIAQKLGSEKVDCNPGMLSEAVSPEVCVATFKQTSIADFEVPNGSMIAIENGKLEFWPGNGSESSVSDRDREAPQRERAACSPSGAVENESADWRALERCILSFVKAFAIGASLRGGLSIFSIITRLRRKSKERKALQTPTAELINPVLKEAVNYGLFLGSFAGTFSTVDELIAAFGGFKRTAKWRTLMAGAVAGPSLLLIGPNVQHTSMAIYIFLRAAVLAARCGIKSENLGWFCKPLAWKHGDVFLMCLSASQILSAWILKPESLPSTYISFLNKHGGKDISITKTLLQLAFSYPLTHLKTVEKYHQSMGMDIKLDANTASTCMVVHGNQDCVPHFFSFLAKAYLRSLPVYLPVYVIPAIIVHRQGLLRKPLPIFSKTLFGTARSSLFLSVYCASSWLWTCMAFRASKMCNPAIVAMGTFPAGLAVMIEKKSRRMEIALYCFARALESFAICCSDGSVVPLNYKMKFPKRTDVIIFSIATAIIMHCYAQEREVFRSKYLNVLDWVFGIPHDGPPIMQPPLAKVSSMHNLLSGRQGLSVPSSTIL